MNKKSCIALVLLVLFVFSSCVTKTKVSFTSDIPGAEVFIDGESMGQTPFTAEVTNAIWED
ncbi:MAG TPA: PEGA domain-containing protein [Treponemataceae bacterium]|nr:PEGA domain-containing protein [Treponemataceae bacterium]HQL03961.1 PEGA domain-containing protein [Treponemataceae bacterium]